MGHDLEITFHEVVQRLTDAAFGRVFDRNHRVVGLPFFHRREQIGDGRQRFIRNTRPKFLDRGGMGVGCLRAEIGDGGRLLEGDRR